MDEFTNGMIATWVENGERQVAIRRDYKWNGGEWSVAQHGFCRVTDAFIAANATILEV